MDTLSVKPQKEITFKQKMIVFGIGMAVAFYLGLLLGASYTGDILKLPENFYQYVVVQHHFIAPFTRSSAVFIGVFGFVWFIIWALWVAKVRHPYKGREYGSRHFIDPKEFSKTYSDCEAKNRITVDIGDTKDYSVFYASGRVVKKSLSPFQINPNNRWISEHCYVDIRNKLTSNLNMLAVGPPGCVTGDTEFFNGEKWKRIDEYNSADKVLQFNPNTGVSSLVKPERFIKARCDGFFFIKSPEVEMMLSSEHEVLYFDGSHAPHKIMCEDFVKEVLSRRFRGFIRISSETEKMAFISGDNTTIQYKPIPNAYKYCFSVPAGALFFRFNGHIFATGNCGKSFRFCKPILSGLNGHYIVTDPKGELCRDTAQYFLDNGYEVLTVDTRDAEGMMKSVRFNPFRYLRDQKDLNEMVEVLLSSTTPPDANKGDPFWEKSETKFFMALFELIFYSYPKERQTWRTLINLIDRTEIIQDEDGNIQPNEIMTEMEKYNEDWKKEHKGTNHPAYQDYKDVFGGAFETVASIVLSAKVRCANMKLESALSMMDIDEMDIFEKFAYSRKTPDSPTGKRVLYLITKESDHSMDWYISILYMTFFTQLYDKADKDFKGKLPFHVTYLMDEFANVTLSQNFRELLSTMRSRNISAIMIVQTYQQLKEKYPKNDGWQGLIGQCCFRVLLGPPDKETREYFSKMLGTTTINKASQSNPQGFLDGGKGSYSQSEDVIQRDLMTVGDLGEIPMTDMIIDVNGVSPIYDEKCKVEEHEIYGLLCNSARNYYPATKVRVMSETKIYTGDEAEEQLKIAKEEGLKIITLSQADLDALFDMEYVNKVDEGCVVSPEEAERNYQEYLEEQKADEISMEDYSTDEMFVVQELKNKGFSPRQIHALDTLIYKGQKTDELLRYFNPGMASSEISAFVTRIAG